jgi:hypothetical protein
MATDDIVKLLLAERTRIDNAIKALQGSDAPTAVWDKRVAKANANINAIRQAKAAKKTRKKRTVSPEARKKMADAAKARWAERKKAAKK